MPEQIRNAPASPAAPDLVAIAKASDIVFVGTVLERGDPPGYWSGRAPAYQILKYRVDDVLRGSVGGGAVAVGHLVVAGAREAEPGDVPALSSTMFAKGARLLVLAVRTSEGRWVGYNSVCGGVPYDADLVARVRAALASTTTDSERPTANHHDER